MLKGTQLVNVSQGFHVTLHFLETLSGNRKKIKTKIEKKALLYIEVGAQMQRRREGWENSPA